MTESQKLQNLRRHQEWRRGGEGELMSPVDVGIAIDYAISVTAAAEALMATKGRFHAEGAYKRLADVVKEGMK